jgi:hypothetical protein
MTVVSQPVTTTELASFFYNIRALSYPKNELSFTLAVNYDLGELMEPLEAECLVLSSSFHSVRCFRTYFTAEGAFAAALTSAKARNYLLYEGIADASSLLLWLPVTIRNIPEDLVEALVEVAHAVHYDVLVPNCEYDTGEESTFSTQDLSNADAEGVVPYNRATMPEVFMTWAEMFYYGVSFPILPPQVDMLGFPAVLRHFGYTIHGLPHVHIEC